MLFALKDGSSVHTVYFLFFIDHPLHSTAVDAYGEEHSQNEALGHVSAPQGQNTDRQSGGKKINLWAFNLIFRFLRFKGESVLLKLYVTQKIIF